MPKIDVGAIVRLKDGREGYVYAATATTLSLEIDNRYQTTVPRAAVAEVVGWDDPEDY